MRIYTSSKTMCVCVSESLCACVSECLCACVYMYVWMDGWMDGWMDVCMYVNIYIYTVRDTLTHTHIQQSAFRLEDSGAKIMRAGGTPAGKGVAVLQFGQSGLCH